MHQTQFATVLSAVQRLINPRASVTHQHGWSAVRLHVLGGFCDQVMRNVRSWLLRRCDLSEVKQQHKRNLGTKRKVQSVFFGLRLPQRQSNVGVKLESNFLRITKTNEKVGLSAALQGLLFCRTLSPTSRDRQ